MKYARTLSAALSAAMLPATLLLSAVAEELPGTSKPVPMTQLDMTIAAAEDRDRTIGELGRRAAELAMEARSAAEADAVLSAFRRTLERCIEADRRPAPPDSGTIRPMLDAMHTESIARRQLDIWAATPEQTARWNTAGIPDAVGYFRGIRYRLREGQTTMIAPAGPYRGEDPDAYGDAPWEAWRLQTLPQWCFRDDAGPDGPRTGYLLLAMRQEPDGTPCFGDPTQDDMLLLRWVRDDGQASMDDGQFLGTCIYPLCKADSVVRSGNRLEIDTTWRSRDDGGPVVYLHDSEYDGFSLMDRTATRLFDAFYIYAVQELDAIGGANGIPPWPADAGLHAQAVWRHPLREDALQAFTRANSPQSADEFAPIPAFDAPGGTPSEATALPLPEETARAFLALYLDRASFAHTSPDTDAASSAVVNAWRRGKEPPLLTIRAESDTTDGDGTPLCADFSISRDGNWLFIEDGYRMPEIVTEDGLRHHRIEDGGGLFSIPDSRRDAIRALLAPLAGKDGP